MRRWPLLSFLAVGAYASAANVDGTLDPAFADGGRALFGFLESETPQMRAIVRYAPSGRVWMFGDDATDRRALYIARTLANGAPDAGFGSNNDGHLRTFVPTTLITQTEFLAIDGALMQTDGKPLVFGALRNGLGEAGAFPAIVCRLNAAGGLDGGFSGDGCATLRTFLNSDEHCNATDAALDADGSIVVIGNCIAETMDARPFVTRLTTAGAIDFEFGAGAGLITPPLPVTNAYSQHYEAVVVRPEGQIAVLGTFDVAVNSMFDLEMGVIQFDGGGSVDTGFSGDGFTSIAFDLGGDNNDRARDLALRPDGRLLALGDAQPGNPERSVALLAQLTTSGAADNSFDGDGRRVDTFADTLDADSRFASLELDTLGRAVVAGTVASRQPAAHAQTGTDFWLVFQISIPPEQAVKLRLAGDVATSGVVSAPAFNVNIPFTITPGVVTEVNLPLAMVEMDDINGQISNRAVHITAQAPISVLTKTGRTFSTGTSIAMPTEALGTRYRVMSWGPSIGFGSNFGVVATIDDTLVTIVPRVAAGGHAAGVPFNVTLDQGQTYYLWVTGDDADLTGSTITANHPVAVMAGNTCALVPTAANEFCDQANEQQRPVSSWGTQFFTAPTLGRGQVGDIVRVLADQSDTSIVIDGAFVAMLGAGQTFDTLRTTATRITTGKPASVAMFALGCKATLDPACPGDPFMMEILPTSQWQTRWHANVPERTFDNQDPFDNRLAVIAPATAVGMVRINGVAIPSASFSAIGSSGFAQAQVSTTVGVHIVDSPDPVAVTLYGFSASEGYGHAATPAPLANAPLPDADDVIVRYKADGARDADFGNGGAVVIDHQEYFGSPQPSLDRPLRAFSDGDGILVGTATMNGASGQHLLLSYRLAAGALFKDSFE